jgi:hypothetical protein
LGLALAGALSLEAGAARGSSACGSVSGADVAASVRDAELASPIDGAGTGGKSDAVLCASDGAPRQ